MQENKASLTSGLAIASIITSLLFFIPLFGLIGLILGVAALIKISKSRGKLSGQGLAIAAIIIGAIRFFLLILITAAILLSLPAMKEAFNRGRYEALSLQAKVNLKNICELENKYKEEHGRYINCPKNPLNIPYSTGSDWQKDMPGWQDIGFVPPVNVYFQYEVIEAGKNSFTAIAVGDLDGDKIYSKYSITQEGNIAIENEHE
jgi:hypothetical protein